jgi:CelD/BcsL family acetyltransferase involved in cellulose biosynthesis
LSNFVEPASAPDITVSVSPPPPALELELMWRQLEAQSEASYFLRWSWIGNWLQGLDQGANPQLVCALRKGEVVGLGLVVMHQGRRLAILPLGSLHLHATGLARQDSISIEHNGFLLHHRDSDAIGTAMLMHLLEQPGGWDRLVLPGLNFRPLVADAGARRLVLQERTQPSYLVDLDVVRQRGGNYLSALSPNTRQQIRQSVKAYERLGPLTLTQANDLRTAQAFMSRLKVLHEQRWQSRGRQGVFSNPWFESFHDRLIENHFRTGEIQLLRASAGEHELGFLYSFVLRGRVYFYQSGFDYDLIDKHGRPGQVTHVLAVGHNSDLGHQTYDFMAGAAQYKHSLCTDQETMYWLSVERDTPSFRLDAALRRIKRRLLNGPSPARAGHQASPTLAATDMQRHAMHLPKSSTVHESQAP